MRIGSGQRLNTVTASPSVTMDGTRVEQVVTTKPFGVTTDDKLSWNFHFEKLTKKIACGIRAMKRVKHLVPKATLRLVDQALIQPHFGYCCTVWRTCGVTWEDKLQNFSIEQLAFWHSQIVTFSNCQRFQLSEILRWKSWPPVNHIKGHHGIQMSTWVSPRLFNFEILWTQYKLQPEELREQTYCSITSHKLYWN